MTKLTHWNPFKTTPAFNPIAGFDDLFRGWGMRPLSREFEVVSPDIRLDVSETDGAYAVKAEMPGIDKKDIEISIDGSQVSISTEMKKEKEEKKGEIVLRSERYVGKQYRSFSLGHDIDESKAEAKYRDGVLELLLPKKSGTATKTLKIS